LGEPGPEQCPARGVAGLFADLTDRAADHVVDLGRIEANPLHERGQRVGVQVHGVDVGVGAAGLALGDRGADGVDQVRTGHRWTLPSIWLWKTIARAVRLWLWKTIARAVRLWLWKSKVRGRMDHMTDGQQASDVLQRQGAFAARDEWTAKGWCRIERALELIGTRSAMLVLRELFY